MVLEIDEERRRISLGMKQCRPNPWEEFADNHRKNDKVRGSIKSITDFGVFIGLPGGIDGLVHLSDLSWSLTGEEAVRNFKKGDEVEAMVLAIDTERERISLGIKQLEGDPFNNYASSHEKGAMVINVDRKNRMISLSIKAKDTVETAEALQRMQAESGAASGTTNLGALLRAKLDKPQE
jgi:small subunit ribosomal protein S1